VNRPTRRFILPCGPLRKVATGFTWRCLTLDVAAAVAVPALTAVPFAAHDIHTQRFAFCAPFEHDESVKMSNPTHGRSSAIPPVLPADAATSIVSLRSVPLFQAGRRTSPTARLRNHQFLFDTNEPLSTTSNFTTHTKQSTSFFLFGTNERSPISTHYPWTSRMAKDLAALGFTRAPLFPQAIWSLLAALERPGRSQLGRDDAMSRKRLI
jgi:hypothetical protein